MSTGNYYAPNYNSQTHTAHQQTTNQLSNQFNNVIVTTPLTAVSSIATHSAQQQFDGQIIRFNRLHIPLFIMMTWIDGFKRRFDMSIGLLNWHCSNSN